MYVLCFYACCMAPCVLHHLCYSIASLIYDNGAWACLLKAASSQCWCLAHVLAFPSGCSPTLSCARDDILWVVVCYTSYLTPSLPVRSGLFFISFTLFWTSATHPLWLSRARQTSNPFLFFYACFDFFCAACGMNQVCFSMLSGCMGCIRCNSPRCRAWLSAIYVSLSPKNKIAQYALWTIGRSWSRHLTGPRRGLGTWSRVCVDDHCDC